MSTTDTAAGTDAVPAPDRSRPPGRARPSLNIQSKLLVMLIFVALLSALVVGLVGYVSGRDSLRAAAVDQLTTIRELRTEEIEREFLSLQTSVGLDSINDTAVQAATAFVDGFAELQSSETTPEQDAALLAFYADSYVPELEQRSGIDFEPEAFVPATPAGRYLQSLYVSNRPYDDYETGLGLDDAGDGSAWSAANARYGSYFSTLVDEVGYEDILVIDLAGNVVFTAYKSVDLGVNLREEPYTNSQLTLAFDEALRVGSINQVVTTDIERYLPALNLPTSWVLSTIGSATDIVGVMAVEVAITRINTVMTGDQQWAEQGLGETGEVYLAGPDRRMRSQSRYLVEHREDYEDAAIANGTSPEVAARIVQVGETVLLQPTDTVSVGEALEGRTGTSISQEYIGTESLTTYSPLAIDGVNWVIVARIETQEAFRPVAEFTRNMVLSTVAILVFVSLLSLLLAQVFTRPINRLVGAVRRVAGGDLAVQVPSGRRDEFGDLGGAFNDMAASLRIKQELIDEQRVENEKLLLTLMPETVAKRYKLGEESIAEEHDNVSVVYAELVGFDEYAQTLTGDQEIVQLNALMRGFDEAAEKVGVEKVRTLRAGYLASSGLIVPRVDNVRRAVDFAREMRRVVSRFSAQNNTTIDLRAGIDTGTVTSGLVARTSLAYDLWGDAVSLAYRVRSVTGQPGIYVSQSVRDRLADSATFREAGTIELRGKSQPVWRVE